MAYQSLLQFFPQVICRAIGANSWSHLCSNEQHQWHRLQRAAWLWKYRWLWVWHWSLHRHPPPHRHHHPCLLLLYPCQHRTYITPVSARAQFAATCHGYWSRPQWSYPPKLPQAPVFSGQATQQRQHCFMLLHLPGRLQRHRHAPVAAWLWAPLSPQLCRCMVTFAPNMPYLSYVPTANPTFNSSCRGGSSGKPSRRMTIWICLLHLYTVHFWLGLPPFGRASENSS